MSLHETMAMCKLDGAQLEDHALLLRSHGERRDRGWRIILEDVGIGSRVGWRVLILGGGNRNIQRGEDEEEDWTVRQYSSPLSTSLG